MSLTDPTVAEKGYPPADPPPPGQAPAGGGRWVAPHYLQFSALYNYASRTYNWTHDEALVASECNAEAMWRDLVISTAVRDRQRPVVQLESQLEPRNPSDPQQHRLKEVLTEVLEDIPDLQQFRRHLLEAVWKGKSGVQCAFAWDFSAGDRRLVVRDWLPVDGDSIVFKFDGTPGILVNPTMLGQPGVERIEHRGGAALFPDAFDRQALVVHEFEREPATYWRPEMAGSVHGSGYRGRVYWWWWLKHNLQKFLFDFLRKAGNGFFLAGYAAGNREELDAMHEALDGQAGQPTIYVPVDQSRDLSKTLVHLPVSLSGSDMQWNIIREINAMIRGAILGESMANEAAPAGIGGGNADHMGMTDDERVRYDARDLDTPMQKLVNVLARYTMPGVRPPRYQHLADKRQPGEVMQAAMWFMNAGGTVPKSWAQEQLGIPEATEGEETLGMVQQQQGVALNSVPAGTPMAGQPGPAAGMGGDPQAGPPQGQQPPAGGDDAGLAAQIQPE